MDIGQILEAYWGLFLIIFCLGFACGGLLFSEEFNKWMDEVDSWKWQRDYKKYLDYKNKFERGKYEQSCVRGD